MENIGDDIDEGAREKESLRVVYSDEVVWSDIFGVDMAHESST